MTFLTFLALFAFSAARRLSELLVLFAYVGLQFLYKSHQILITQQSSISANEGQVIKQVVVRMRMVQRCGDAIVLTRTRPPLLVWNCHSCRHLGLLSSSSRSWGDAGVNKKSIDKRKYACWYARELRGYIVARGHRRQRKLGKVQDGHHRRRHQEAGSGERHARAKSSCCRWGFVVRSY